MRWNRSHLLAALVGATLGLVVALGLVAAGVVGPFSVHDPSERVGAAPPPVVMIAPPPLRLPAPARDLGREELLKAFAAAADAVASGKPLQGENAKLVDRKFSIRLPFGCSGPMDAQSTPWAGWSYNPGTKALKLQARPENWKESPWIQDLAGDMPVEAVEGFWIRRPWSSAQSCPPSNITAAPSRDGQRETVAIAQFFSPDSPRALRRGARPYSFTTRLEESIGPMRDYGLIIEGRIVGFPDGQPIHCRDERTDLRPICLMAVEFSRVAFEDVDGDMLTEWRS